MLFTLRELVDAVGICIALGFIFHTVFRKPKPHNYDPLLAYTKGKFSWEDFYFAMAVTAPAVILHELGHKFVALAFGLSAVFHAAYGWLLLGIALRLMNFNFIFFVPAFVRISGGAGPEHILIAFAGPAVNLILFCITWLMLKYRKYSAKVSVGLVLTKRINLLLFVFNMLPIPGFDGYYVFRGVSLLIFGG
jgi:Zn-dependent protease